MSAREVKENERGQERTIRRASTDVRRVLIECISYDIVGKKLQKPAQSILFRIFVTQGIDCMDQLTFLFVLSLSFN